MKADKQVKAEAVPESSLGRSPGSGSLSRSRGSDSLSRSRERAGVRARDLRRNSTDAESALWNRLRSRQLLGLKFRRQHPIANFFADFACVEIGLVIELDGGQHVEQISYDEYREHAMRAAGFQTIRFWNHDVLKETEAVMERIRQQAECLALTPALSREREREQDTSHCEQQRQQDKEIS